MRVPWDGNEFFPRSQYPYFAEAAGTMPIARLVMGGEMPCSFRFPPEFGYEDLVKLAGTSNYIVRLWNVSGRTVLATRRVAVGGVPTKKWPPARPPWEDDAYGAAAPTGSTAEARAPAQAPALHSAFEVTVAGQRIAFAGEAGSLLTGLMGLATALGPALLQRIDNDRMEERRRFDALVSKIDERDSRIFAMYQEVVVGARADAREALDRASRHDDRMLAMLQQVFDQGSSTTAASPMRSGPTTRRRHRVGLSGSCKRTSETCACRSSPSTMRCSAVATRSMRACRPTHPSRTSSPGCCASRTSSARLRSTSRPLPRPSRRPRLRAWPRAASAWGIC
jgi:hypothetical protein